MSETRYGKVDGLCGVNCRHSFYPFFRGQSQRTYDQATLNEYKNKTVEWNGQKLTIYEANQVQRGFEREIREVKRQAEALGSAGIDNTEEMAGIRSLQQNMRGFIRRTGLDRQYEREGGRVERVAIAPPVSLPLSAPIPIATFPMQGYSVDYYPSPQGMAQSGQMALAPDRAMIQAQAFDTSHRLYPSLSEDFVRKEQIMLAVASANDELIVSHNSLGELTGATSFKFDAVRSSLFVEYFGTVDTDMTQKLIKELRRKAEDAGYCRMRFSYNGQMSQQSMRHFGFVHDQRTGLWDLEWSRPQTLSYPAGGRGTASPAAPSAPKVLPVYTGVRKDLFDLLRAVNNPQDEYELNERLDRLNAIYPGFDEYIVNSYGTFKHKTMSVKIRRVQIDQDLEVSLRGNVLDASGNIAEISRSIDANHGEIHNGLFKFYSNDTRDQGFGAAFYSQQEHYAIRAGFKKISVHADIDVGGYAWARMGYDFESKTGLEGYRSSFAQELTNRITGMTNTEAKNITDKFEHAWEFAQYEYPGWKSTNKFVPDGDIGHQIMLGTSWYGKKILDTADLGWQVGEEYYTLKGLKW